jgi:hypothetical protein
MQVTKQVHAEHTQIPAQLIKLDWAKINAINAKVAQQDKLSKTVYA